LSAAGRVLSISVYRDGGGDSDDRKSVAFVPYNCDNLTTFRCVNVSIIYLGLQKSKSHANAGPGTLSKGHKGKPKKNITKVTNISKVTKQIK
jgi:hypothetical protein